MSDQTTQDESNIIDLFESFEQTEEQQEEQTEEQTEGTQETEETQEQEEQQEEQVDQSSILAQQAAQIQQLTAAVSALTAHFQAQQVQPPAQKAMVQEPKEGELIEFIKDEEGLTSLLSSPQALNKMLNKVLQMGEARGREQAVAHMPSQVRAVMQQEQQKATVINSFFAANKDLAPHKDLVGLIAQNLVREQPAIDTQTLLKETAKQTRARLGLKASVATTSKVGSPAKKAGLPTGKAGSLAGRPKEEVKTQALQDLQDLGILP